MTKPMGVLLGLLLVTNVAWAVVWMNGQEQTASDEPLFEDARDETIDTLRTEVERLKAERPLIPETHPTLQARGKTETTEKPSVEDTEVATAKAAEMEKRRAAMKAQQKAYAAAREQATASLRKVMQIEDPTLRAEGFEELAAALTGSDEYLIEYTLSGIWSAKEIPFDKERFTALIEPLLTSDNAGIRRSALYAIHGVDKDAAEIGLALASAKDPHPTVRQHAARILRMHIGRTVDGESADAIVSLLTDEHANVRKGTLRALWGTEVSSDVESQLLDMAKQPESRHDAVYFGLSTLENKSKRVVDELFTHLLDKNHDTRGRAHWGLGNGVQKDLQPYVAKTYAERLTKFVNPHSHREALKLIVKYGDTTVIPELERFAANDMAEAGVRDLARRAALYIQKRADGGR